MMQFKDDIRIRQPKKHDHLHWARIWFILVGIGIILAALSLGYSYLSLSPMRHEENRLQRLVKEKTDIATVQKVNVNYRQQTTYAVIGTTSSGKEKVAIVHAKNNSITMHNRSNGMSNDQIRRLIVKNYKPRKIYSVNISEYKRALVWEVSYKGENETLNYVTLDFKTGKPYRVIKGL